ncbi:MAG: o-succinylbenzoate synthase [Opitutaceae bacterium]|nr:o-succinylbenzoate synthase [Opitutaceae bacterium]
MRLRVSHRTYVKAFQKPLRTAHGFWSTREGILVRLEDDTGRHGYGEMAPIPGFEGESALEMVARLASLGSYVELTTLHSAFPAGAGRFAIDTALRALGVLPPYERRLASVPVAALLPAGRACVPTVVERLEQGFRTFKWKVGVSSAADEIALLDDLLAELPSGARLRLDANGAWDRRLAERWLAVAAERPIDYIEQPAGPGDADLLLGLAGDYPTPLALDESVANETDFEFWLGEGWPGVWILKPALLGSPLDWVELLRTRKARFVFSSAIEGPIARRSALELVFSQQVAPEPIGFGLGEVFSDSWDGTGLRPFLHAQELDSFDTEAAWKSVR